MNEAALFIERWKNAQKGLLKEGADCSYLYVHLEADSNEPFYVGMGETFDRPWQQNRSKKHKNRANKHGVKVHVEAMPSLTWENAQWWEVRWIKAFRDAGYDLVNLTDGGDGTKGYKRSNEEKQLFRKINNRPEIKIKNSIRMQNNNPMKNRETAEAVAKLNRGRKLSPESIEASASKRRGIPKTEEQNKATGLGNKRVWDSLSVAGRKARGDKRKAAHDLKTSEERSLVISKGWETRRRNQLLKQGVE